MKTDHARVSTRLRRSEDEHAEAVVFAADHGSVRLRNMEWQPATEEATNMCIVAELEGRVVGRAMLEAMYPPFAEIQNVHVLRSHGGRGAGGALLDECFAQAAGKGFMALFLQTGAENVAAQRLYARKGFLLAGRAQMLRLVRFVNLPVLDAFLHGHPLATYAGSAGDAEGTWHLTWADWPSGDRLQLTLTGGTCQGDSNGLGPGLCTVSLRSGGTELSARLGGRDGAGGTGTVTLGLAIDNTGGPVGLRTSYCSRPGASHRAIGARPVR